MGSDAQCRLRAYFLVELKVHQAMRWVKLPKYSVVLSGRWLLCWAVSLPKAEGAEGLAERLASSLPPLLSILWGNEACEPCFPPKLGINGEPHWALISGVCFLSQGAAVMMENLPNFVKFLLSGALAGLGQEAFMNRTVGEIMWGYDDPLIDAINKIVPGLIPFKGKFGLFKEVSCCLGTLGSQQYWSWDRVPGLSPSQSVWSSRV